MKKILLICLVCAALLSSLSLVQVLGAAYVFDSKIESVLHRVQSKVPGLSLLVASNEGAFGSRKIVINYDYALPDSLFKLYKTKSIYGAFEFNLNIGVLSARSDIKPVYGYGNLDVLTRSFSRDSIDYHGVFEGSVFTGRASGAFKIKPIRAANESLKCTIGESGVFADLKSLDTLAVELKSAGVICTDDTKYNYKNALELNVRDLLISTHLDIANRSIKDSIEVALSIFDLDFSTVYALGFKNDEKVKDMSVRERFTLEKVNTALRIDNKGADKNKLRFDGAASLSIFMPYIKNNEIQRGIVFDDMLMDFEIDGLLLKNYKKTMQSNSSQKAIYELLGPGAFRFSLNNASFKNNGAKSSCSASLLLFIDESTKALTSIDGNADIELSKNFIGSLPPSYQRDMENACRSGTFIQGPTSYKSSVNYKDRALFINGQRLDLKAPNDDDSIDNAPEE